MSAQTWSETVFMPYIGPLFVGKTPRPVTVYVGRYRSQWAVFKNAQSFVAPIVQSVHKTKRDAIDAAGIRVSALKAKADAIAKATS